MDYDYFVNMTGVGISEDEFDDLLEMCEQLHPDLFNPSYPSENAEEL